MRVVIPLLILCLCGLKTCQDPSGSASIQQRAALHYTEGYELPYFEDEERIRHIGDALKQAHRHYSDAAEQNHLPGLVYGLVVDDSLVFYGGTGFSNLEQNLAANENSLFRIASMTKSFTAMAILKLRDDGLLALSDPISTYLPELDPLYYLTSDAPPISIYNLLTMTAGFPEDNPWGDRFLDIGDDALMELVAGGISFSTVPGTQYEYSNLGFGLLGQIISRASGQSYQDYISGNILHPLGMRHTYYEYDEAPYEELALGYRLEDGEWASEPLLHDGALGAMGGMITSIADFSKYVSFHLSAWPARNDPDTGPVKRSTLREMHHMYNPRYYKDPDRFGDPAYPVIRGYGFGLVAMKDQEGILELGHNGGLPGFGSSYMFFPHHGIGIMAFSNLTYVGGKVRSANYRVMKELIEQGLFKARTLPVSEVLERRKEQVKELLLTWDPELEKELVAENLYMDIPRDKRIQESAELLDQLGEILSTGPIIPENQLRGSFELHGKEDTIRVYFTLSPEAEPRVQWLSLSLLP
jgi:CubicO group peptidase (beta-lactamase class C family)